ncbi:PhzF family phenazine biosynthesis protein [Catenovulum sp. 2E275]|uniref:PhzF family phenazine biosynthesis protein n=1 Tax=Catenovulum sp. 2E275 TaxID=2980497 RepID=UPI0021CE0E4F|nr:PhzF family phenazine biosynthesis protein [Catenovulum sp. 2E275]MCU4676511.1 PhzF family phenazine biosynthesis protein [Catenovulum sp. 2E275]
MQKLNYFTVDVFTGERFQGAQIAVVPDAAGLSEQQMMKIAAEFNLWRSVFIVPSDKADKKIRVFNGKREFNFGGHPTLAAIYCLAKQNRLDLTDGDNQFSIEETHGLVKCKVKIENGEPVFNQFVVDANPEYDSFAPTEEELASFLNTDALKLLSPGFKPMLVATEIPYLIVPVDSLETLKQVRFSYDTWASSTAPATCANAILLFARADDSCQADFHCRMVGPVFGMHEDPPVGAAMPAFSGYLSQFTDTPQQFVVERGVYQARYSYLHIDIQSVSSDKITLSIGGQAVLSSQGSLFLD